MKALIKRKIEKTFTKTIRISSENHPQKSFEKLLFTIKTETEVNFMSLL